MSSANPTPDLLTVIYSPGLGPSSRRKRSGYAGRIPNHSLFLAHTDNRFLGNTVAPTIIDLKVHAVTRQRRQWHDITARVTTKRTQPGGGLRGPHRARDCAVRAHRARVAILRFPVTGESDRRNPRLPQKTF